jgi:hypothetical protein
MNTRNKNWLSMHKTIALTALMLLFITTLLPATAFAATDPACQKFLDKNGDPTPNSKQCEKDTPAACLGQDRSTVQGERNFENCLSQNVLIPKNNRIVQDLNDIVKVLSGLVGIAVVGTIIVGGMQYTAAGDKPEALQKAKQRITNGLIALGVFLLTFAFLQWLVPGGIFNS